MKMKKIEFVYLNFIGKFGKKNQINILNREIGGIAILEVIIEMKNEKNILKKEKNLKKLLYLLKRKGKKYKPTHNMIGMNNLCLEWMKVDDMNFKGRKDEFLRNEKLIFSFLKKDLSNKKKKEEDLIIAKKKRSSILFVIEGEGWNERELYEVFMVAKDCFEDLYIQGNEKWKNIIEILYEDSGVEIQVLSKGEAKNRWMDVVVFFMVSPNQFRMRRYAFMKSYVIFEKEKEFLQRKEDKESINQLQEKRIYSGLVYEKNEKVLPYQMAVNMIAQGEKICSKFNISIVDIYLLE